MVEEVKQIIHWEDINVTARLEYIVDGAPRLEFSVYDICGLDENGQRLYERNDDSGETEDIEVAQPLFHGFIKWDGCSHIYFGDEGYVHACGFSHWQKLSEATKRVWNYATDAGFSYEEFAEKIT